MKKSNTRNIKGRTWVQIFFFDLIALISVNHTLVENGGGIPFLSTASLHTLCPFGGVISLYQYLIIGIFVLKSMNHPLCSWRWFFFCPFSLARYFAVGFVQR
jgi:hypothetical protein